MNQINYEEAILQWRNQGGKGCALISLPLDGRPIILGVLQRMYIRNPTQNILIVVDNFDKRTDLVEFLTHQEDKDNNAEFSHLITDKFIRILTKDYIIKYYHIVNKYTTCILYNLSEYDNKVLNVLEMCKFKFVIFNKLIDDIQTKLRIYKSCPLLPIFDNEYLEKVRLSTPVEETQIGVSIPADSEANNLLKHYTEYISSSLSIFGSFDIMNQARLGNSQLNISATTICNQIAAENGWRSDLDMSIQLNREIDNMYNPINLRDRAGLTYEAIRNRANLLTDYEEKLEAIRRIVNNNPDKNILIISKRGEFASKITDYVNTFAEDIVCANYHNKVEDIPAVDIDGNPVYYKSGIHKGQRKLMSVQAQCTLNEKKFNLGLIHCLSTNNSPDKDLEISVDIIIITSPLCEDIKSYKYRLSNISYGDKIDLYTIYVTDSIEEQKLQARNLEDWHKIIKNDKNSADFDKNFNFALDY